MGSASEVRKKASNPDCGLLVTPAYGAELPRTYGGFWDKVVVYTNRDMHHQGTSGSEPFYRPVTACQWFSRTLELLP
jgi:hypothetical protein